jgi:5'-3' exoribonuclease 1
VALKLLVPNDEKFMVEPTFAKDIIRSHRLLWIPAFALAKQLNLPALALSKITSSFRVEQPDKPQEKLNLGLNLKFEAKQQKVVGYTRKTDAGVWEYSSKAIGLIRAYKDQFPELFAQLSRKARQCKY